MPLRRPPARSGTPRKEVPLRRRRAPQQPGWTQMSRRQARRLARDPKAQQQAQLVQLHDMARLAARLGMTPAVSQAGQIAMPAPVPPRRVPGWRFRRHVQPFAWMGLLLICGHGCHVAPHPLAWGAGLGIAVPAVMILVAGQKRRDGRPVFTRWARRFTCAEAAATAAWLPVIAYAGLRVTAAWAVLSGLPFCALWVRRYAWRPDPRQADEEPVVDDYATFAALCGEQKWRAHLGAVQRLDGGGRSYPIQCDGIKTVTKKILAQPDNVAGAWHSAVTEVYAERDPAGVTSRGRLTILPGSSLRAGRYWDGQGMDPATGLVRTGRYADGTDVHEKWYEPRYGCYHDLDSGTTGSGKSALLELKVFIALQTGWFVPVILDPQEGQSLPFWREKCIYAAGEDQVGRRLRGLYAAFQDRSSFLSTYRWSDDGVDYPGMPFFDYGLLGGSLKIPLIILDEAHLVLKDKTRWQRQITSDVVDMARLIRKAGGRMVLATQLPSLVDLGGSQALRDMLRGGNVWSGRTANKVSTNMLGLVKDPSEIPRFFADGSKTPGLGYADGPDARPDAPMRTDRPAREHYKNPPPVPQLDDRFLEVMDRAMAEAVSPTATVAPVRGEPAAGPSFIPKPGALEPPAAELTVDEPAGRRCVDAVLQVLTDAAGPLERSEVFEWVGSLSKAWERDKCWSLKAVQNALRDLLAEGTITQPDGKGSAYQLARQE